MNVYQVILKGVFQVEFDKTMKFNIEELPKEEVRTVLLNVYNTLEERGYSPINQIVGYLLSGDPAYIPRHNDARNQIRRLDRDEIMEQLVSNYISSEKTDE
ncbi:IreB family regulatory phosphoprotein [Macrococcoides caseolyticum subsp. hominis]|nr:IreB family regulatory phosphoprotein [Macrococcus caseolyticus]RAI82100.1 IreB family regulatory phosphoprotein [Macrococcus caseolyticus subsp. hominis]RKO17381.1 IreB family regulatory phosphoprotein [Macrococcus caseolyticus]